MGQFKDALAAAESTGLRPTSFNSLLAHYLLPARAASEDGYSAAFIAVSVLCLVALVLMILLIRKPPGPPEPAETTPAESRAGASRDTDQRSGTPIGHRRYQAGDPSLHWPACHPGKPTPVLMHPNPGCQDDPPAENRP